MKLILHVFKQFADEKDNEQYFVVNEDVYQNDMDLGI